MINSKISKKASTHIEIMLSFVIFISFVTFMLISFKPFKTLPVDTSSLELIESKITGYLSSNLTVSSLLLNPSFYSAASCIYAYFPLPSNIVVKDENSNIVNADTSAGDIYLKYNGKRVYRIYSSEELEEKTLDITSCYKLNESNYTIGVTRTYEKISYYNLFKLDFNYASDYESLKKNLTLINDFTFIVRDNSGVIFEGKRDKPEGVDIIVKDIPIEIFDENASLNPAVLNIQVWE